MLQGEIPENITKESKIENIGESIINKKSFGKIVVYDNAKEQKHLKPCDPALDVTEIPVLRVEISFFKEWIVLSIFDEYSFSLN